MNSELAERVSELRQKGRTPKEIARALGVKPADVMPVIRAIGAQAPRREAPVAGLLGDRPLDRQAGRDRAR